jgi:ABC-type antimicrobial peptide transport system permease subunit
MRSIDPVAGNDSLDTFLQTQIQLLGSEGLMQRTVQKLLESNPPVVTSPKPVGWHVGSVATQARSESTSDAAWHIAKNLSVKGSGLTRLVEIVCESPHPGMAAEFANTLAAEYIEQNLENRWDSTRKTGDWLTKKVQELKGKLQTAEENLQAYSLSAGLVYTSDKDSVTMEELRRLEVEHPNLRTALTWAIEAGDVALMQPGGARGTMVLEEMVNRAAFSAPKFALGLMATFAGVGLILSAIGVFSVMTYTVSLQTREIGIRMALGARPASVMRRILLAGLLPISIGAVLGIAAAYGLSQLMANQIYGVTATDPWTFAGVVVVLAGVGLMACVLPARRAMRVDPLVALRSE